MAEVITWIRRLGGLLWEPGRALALLKGQWYRFYYPLRGVQFQAGSRLHAYGRLRIRGGAQVVLGDLVYFDGELLIEGPGAVVIGNNVEIRGGLRIQGGSEVILGNRVTICKGLQIRGPGRVVFGEHIIVWEESVLHTHTREARIVIGARTKMLGAHFTCALEILVGQECLIAPAKILDSDFHSTRVDRHSDDSPVRVAPVSLGDNVWVGESAALLAGTKVGKNSVVGFGAICMREFPDNVIILGNPARVSAPIPAATEVDSRALSPEVRERSYVTRGYLTGRREA
jgi:acetyltransferase-like isoleucine patch superfamily enzyme